MPDSLFLVVGSPTDSLNLGENMTPNFLSCQILNVSKVNIAFKTLQDLFVYFSNAQFTAFRKTETFGFKRKTKIGFHTFLDFFRNYNFLMNVLFRN